MVNSVPAPDGGPCLPDAHLPANLHTPLRSDAFVLTDEQKISGITEHFREIMHLLGLDLTP